MVSFKLSRHYIHGVDVVEVWYKDKFIATICQPPPGDTRAAITVVSKHINPESVIVDDTGGPEPIVVMIPFDC